MGEVISVLNVATDEGSGFLVVALSLAADLKEREPEDEGINKKESAANEEQIKFDVIDGFDSERISEPEHDKSDDDDRLDTEDYK